MTTKILVAGDHFVLNGLLLEALNQNLEATDLATRELTLPWPLEPFGPVGEVIEASGSEDALIEALQGMEICVSQMAPLTQNVLEACPDLKLFSVTRGGPVNANLDAAARHGVAVTYAPGRNAAATAEHTIGMMLASMRRIPQTNADLSAGTWRGDYYTHQNVGLELEHSTVGLLGFGAIGSRVAKILHGFGAEVLVYDPYVTDQALDGLARKVGLEDLLALSHVVSLHARVTPETTGVIGSDEIAAMREGSILINCARAALTNYDAICDALDSGHLAGAAFDVFPEEPLSATSRLLRTPNIVMTPHLAGASKATATKAAQIAAKDINRYLTGQPLLHCANPQVFSTQRP